MRFKVPTKGHYDFINLTGKVNFLVKDSGVSEGVVLIFVTGTTAALTVIEDEEGVKKDLKNIFEKMAPEASDYEHHKKWDDHNGAAHIKSGFLGPDLTVPVEQGKLALGTWQQIVLIDFDERPREREIIVKVIKDGENFKHSNDK